MDVGVSVWPLAQFQDESGINQSDESETWPRRMAAKHSDKYGLHTAL
jgi:hypothetical protein